MAAARDVISTGRIRTSALFRIASRISYPSRNSSCIRLIRINAPCTATPKSGIHPTAAEILKCVPVTSKANTPPTREMGTDRNVMETAFSQRRLLLEEFFKNYCSEVRAITLSPQTASIADAMTWLPTTGWYIDGLVAKNNRLPYMPGERVMQKYKSMRTADCVVGGFRYGSDSREVGSLLLGLYDENGRLNHVGFTSGIPKAAKPLLTKTLEKLIHEPGFDGEAPGGPSRWSTDRSTQMAAALPDNRG